MYIISTTCISTVTSEMGVHGSLALWCGQSGQQRTCPSIMKYLQF